MLSLKTQLGSSPSPGSQDPTDQPDLRGSLNAIPFPKDLPNSSGLELCEAHSYTWGEPEFSHRIICNRKQIHITLSLFQALQQLRRSDKERILWIDAICINESGDAEKQFQIPLMRD